MNNSEHGQGHCRKTIYDGIRITKRGTDVIIALLSLTLAILFIFAISGN